MSVRWKLLLILVLVLVLFAGLQYAVERRLIAPSFAVLQHEDAEDDVTRGTEALAREVSGLDSTAHDWSAWDDTYRFVHDHNPEFAKANLLPSALGNLRVDILCLHDTRGRLAWGGTLRRGPKGALVLSPAPWGDLPPDDPLVAIGSLTGAMSGALMTARGPVLVASRPIVTSDETGPIRRVVVMGRLLDENLIRKLSSQTRVDLSVCPIGAGHLVPEAAEALAQLGPTRRTVVNTPGGGLVHAYATFPGLTGKPLLLIRAEVPSDITARGHVAVAFAQASSLAGGVLLLVVLALLLGRTVVGPLARLTRQVTRIGQSNDLSARVSAGDGDEIGALAHEFNAMLEAAEARDQALARVHRLSAAVVTTIPSALVMADAELNVLDVNQGFYEQWAPAASGELTGRLLDILPDCLLATPGLLEGICEVAREGGTSAFAGIRAGPDRDVDIRVCGFEAPRSGAEDERQVLIVIDDKTDENLLQEQMRQAAKLQAVGTLAGGIAHNLNNMLTGITGFTELTLTELADDSPVGADLRRVADLADRAAELTRQLLAFSRRQAPAFTRVDLDDLVARSARMLRPLIRENIELDLVGAGDLGAVRADPSQIQQVLVNLAVNARDAMPTGGRLTIATRNQDLDEAAAARLQLSPGRYVVLTVTDTGCGMDQATQQRIFEPFFTTKDVGEGTGLGLATVYGIVEQHQGRVAVTSEPGRGTVFTIYFPCLEPAETDAASEEAPLPARGRGETVLLVEDDDAVRQIAQRVLDEQGYRVLAAADALEGEDIATWHDGAIDLLLTDVVMPGRNGRELYDRLASSLPNLRVLFMSGYTDGLVLGGGLPDLSAPLLRKPFTPVSLARKTREVLDAGRGSVQRQVRQSLPRQDEG